eukprot:scaffold109392_cov72-Phaeocystis_antarctica.AAC.7
MKTSVNARLAGESDARPWMPLPHVQPMPSLAPRPTSPPDAARRDRLAASRNSVSKNCDASSALAMALVTSIAGCTCACGVADGMALRLVWA